MLYTNLTHLETARDLGNMIRENEKVLVVCGRMDPLCVHVYRIVETLEKEFRDIKFCDMEFDNPESLVVRETPEIEFSSNVPFIVYYHYGIVVTASSGLQTKMQITNNINELFLKTEKV